MALLVLLSSTTDHFGGGIRWSQFLVAAQQRGRDNAARSQSDLIPGNHTSNAAVLVSSSRFWHNYRHVSNVLTMYNLLKNHGGLRDEDIILMIADDMPCNARNPFKNGIFPKTANGGNGETFYGPAVEIDYRGTDVTVDAFLRVLTGRHKMGELPSRTLSHLSPGTNVLVYLTGHGGDQFFKFQDGEEITAQDLASTFTHMKDTGRYNDLLLVADTCQAFTLDPSHPEIHGSDRVRDVTTFASSLKDQNSYAHHSDTDVGMSVVDRYTYHVSEFLTKRGRGGGRDALEGVSLKEAMFDSLRSKNLGADVGMNDASSRRRTGQVALCDFLCAASEGSGVEEGGGNSVEVLRERWEHDELGASGAADMVDAEAAAARSRRLKQYGSEGKSPLDRGRDDEPKQDGRRGMRSSDPRFLLCVAGLMVAVRLSSKK